MEFAETKLTTMFNFFINNSTECILFYRFEEKSSTFGKTNLVTQSEFSHELKKIWAMVVFFLDAFWLPEKKSFDKKKYPVEAIATVIRRDSQCASLSHSVVACHGLAVNGFILWVLETWYKYLGCWSDFFYLLPERNFLWRFFFVSGFVCQIFKNQEAWCKLGSEQWVARHLVTFYDPFLVNLTLSDGHFLPMR